MPKKRPLDFADSYLKKKTKIAEDALSDVKSVFSRYLKKHDPLRVEIDDLYRRYKVFSDSATKFLEDK